MWTLKHLVFCSLLSLPLIHLTTIQEIDLLDLTKKKVSTEPGKIAQGEGGLIGGSGIKPTDLPLKIVLEKLDKQQYLMGERFIYELSIENIGKRILEIPWEPEKEKTLQSSNELSVISLHLTIDELGNDAIFGAERIFASQNASNTFKQLRPGGRLRIRAPGIWYLGNQEAARRVFQMLPRQFTVKAQVKLGSYPTDTMTFKPAYSNAILIELRKKQN